MFDPVALIDQLDRFGPCLPALLGRVPAEDARWRPPDGAWSILEIVSHLADEEVDDFRTRVRMTLEDPSQPWPGIDPEGWAVQRKYNEGDLASTLDRLTTERRASIQWLRSLPADVDWSRAWEHPHLGTLRAGDILVSWAAHDTLHLRQIAKRLYQLASAQGKPAGFSAGYAGAW